MTERIDDLPSDPDELRTTITNCERWLGYVNDAQSRKAISNFRRDAQEKLNEVLGVAKK
jgi:hypothetical protein